MNDSNSNKWMLHEAIENECMCPMSKLTNQHTGKLFKTILVAEDSS